MDTMSIQIYKQHKLYVINIPKFSLNDQNALNLIYLNLDLGDIFAVEIISQQIVDRLP